jgi:hypothetical protein
MLFGVGCPFPSTARALGFATQDHAQARDSNAAQGNTKDIEATLANLLRNVAARPEGQAAPGRLTYSIFRSDCHLLPSCLNLRRYAALSVFRVGINVEGKASFGDCLHDFRERAAIFDHAVRGALYNARAPGFATHDHAQARDSNAAQGNTQDMEATSANLLRKDCQGCSKARRPSRPRPTYSIFRSDCHLAAMDSADWRLRPDQALVSR